ncbi:MAG: bifunctional 3'-5' exonuclease/DNA polymerase [Bacteroidaceae bacterium]|nr:bifunctional 3'-5' exonuclease/DNA polymerase [Bacteroidaceae bacterium]
MLIPKYRTVTDPEAIKNYLAGATVVAFDFETAPDDLYRDYEGADNPPALDSHRAHIVGCSFSKAVGNAIYVPIAHLVGPNCPKEEFFKLLTWFLTNRDITKVAHNLEFEAKMSYALGIVIQPKCYDTLCAAQLSLKDEKFRELRECGLKTLSKELLGTPLPTFEDVTAGRYFDELSTLDAETVRYACADSDYALRLYHYFNNYFATYNGIDLRKHANITLLESIISVYCGIMNHNGCPVDLEAVEEKLDAITMNIEEKRDELNNLTGIDVGENCSGTNFSTYLYDTLKLPPQVLTNSGKPATNKEAIQELTYWASKNDREDIVELLDKVEEYRKLTKLKSTYLKKFAELTDNKTGCIHPNFQHLSTATGRMSCNNPNMQNMPRAKRDPMKIRDLIKAPEVHSLITCDLSQIELRIGSFFSRDERMLETYNSNGDIHALTTSLIYGISYEEAKDENAPDYKNRRGMAKVVNFGSMYGLNKVGLQRRLKAMEGLRKSLPECQAVINSILRGYPRITRWQEQTIKEAKMRRYSLTYMGRIRLLPDINVADQKISGTERRRALNHPIQGTAADVMKIAMCRIILGLPERPWLKPFLQIHDEISFVVPDDKVEEAKAFVKACMEQKPFPQFDVPLIAEPSSGKSFGQLK